MATPKNAKTTVSTTNKTAKPAVKKVVKTSTETQKSVDWGNIMKGALTIGVIVLLILGIAWLGKKVFAPEKVADTNIPSSVTSYTQQQDSCLYQAGKLGLPTDIANTVCNGSEGQVSEQLPSGTKVPFGTITFDCESRVWVLKNFTVPSIASYAFSYENAERNLLNAPFLVGSELGWSKDCKENNVPFVVCYNTTDDGCKLPESVNLFPTK
jgi:hypothetical protein